MSEVETQQTYTSKDVLSYALAKDAANLSTAFNSVVGTKVLDAIQQKKVELAKRMFNPEVEVETKPEEEDTETVAASSDQKDDEDIETNDTEVTISGEEERNDEIAQQNT